MKKHVLMFLAFGLSGLGFATGLQPVEVAVTKAYIPVGFDSNDLPQFLVTGTFPDLCYQVAAPDVRVDEKNQRITLVQKAYRTTGDHCWAVKVPFEQIVQLPPLADGNYEVWDGKTNSKLGTFPISRASQSGTGTDDYPYAPVSAVQLKPKMPFGFAVVLYGVLTNDCLSVGNIQVDLQPDVLVVKPILQMVTSPTGQCQTGHFPFRVEKSVGILGTHPYLIHVRSLNGQALNQLMDPHKKFPMDPVHPIQ